MSPTPSMSNCRGLEDWRKDAPLVIMYKISIEKVAIAKKIRLRPSLRQSWNVHTSSFFMPPCKTQ